MTYTLHLLAAGSYDLALDGVLVGGVVRETMAGGAPTGWCAELLEDLPAATRPRPFDCVEHRFPTFEAAVMWLGGAPILALLWQIEETGQVFVDSCAMAMVMGDRNVRDWPMA